MPEVAEKPNTGSKRPLPVAQANMETVYSIYPSYMLVLEAEERVQREATDGRIISIINKKQRNLQFNHHKAQVDEETVKLIKTKLWYGTDFITASDLKKMLDDKNSTITARGFIREMHRRSVVGGLGRQAMDEMKILQELVELKV